MTQPDPDAPRISRAVPLDQLRQPETDVRDHRPQAQVKSLAASMGDPDVGQLQDILVHPTDHEEVIEDRTEAELDFLFREGHPLRIVDGETRRLAAQRLGWATVDATIVPEPPENTVIAQLDANTERIDMTGFETCRALKQHYEQTDLSQADLAAKVGFDRSYLSTVFNALDGPDFMVEAWRHPEHPLETGHALAVHALLSTNSIERYQEAGGLDEEAAHDRALEDARLMVGVQADHDLSVTEFRQRAKRCRQESLDSLRSAASPAQAQADGQASEADHRERSANAPEVPDCLVCGSSRDHNRKIAVPVCEQDYGMLADARANDDTLLDQGGIQEAPPQQPQQATDGSSDGLTDALAQHLGLGEEQAQQALSALEQQVSAQEVRDGG